MKKDIGNVLREKRLKAGLTVQEVSAALTAKNYKASSKTVYSWENGNSQPSLEILLELCDMYDIKDILFAFGYDGYNEDGSIQLNIKEQDMIERYRFISKNSPDGAKMIDSVIDREYSVAQQLTDLRSRPAAVVDLQNASGTRMAIYTYMRKIAAAGNGFYFDDIPTETIEAPYMEGADFIIGVSGDSMEPTYSDGDLVYVEKRQVVETGAIGIFMLNNECFIKEAGEGGLISHNPKYKIIPGSDQIMCIGKVLGKVN